MLNRSDVMITMNDVIRDYHPTLRLKAKKIDFPLNTELRQLADEMIDFLKNSQNPEIAEKYSLRPGVGIAAPQLDISKQLIAIQIPGDSYEEEPLSLVMVNPRIIRQSVKLTALSEGEGCLSIDEVYEGLVPRSKRITVEYYDLDGQKHTEKFRDYPAIVVQHEIDHLNGILFYDLINEEDPYEIPENLELFDFPVEEEEL